MWFVKQVSRATKNNPNFAGDVSVSIYGKGQKMLAHCGNHAEKLHITQKFDPYIAKLYGYRRRHDAWKSWIYKNPENSEYWESEVSIVWKDC